MLQKLALLVLLSVTPFFLWGCRGGPCERVRADKRLFEQPNANATTASGHQIEALVPLALVQKQLNDAFLQFKGVAFQFSSLGQIGSFLGSFDIQPQRLSLFTKDKRLMVATDFTVKDDQQKALFTVGVQGVVDYEFANDSVSFAITPQGFRFLGMLINEQAVSMLVAHFRTQIPPSIAAFLPEHLVVQAADLALIEFQKLWKKHVADQVAQGVAANTRLKIKLPNLPFVGFELKPIGNVLAIELKTAIRTTTTLAPLQHTQLPDDEIQIRMAGGLIAELGNQAIKQGIIPAHYNLQGQADPNGPFTPALKWVHAERPFQLILWSTGDLCARVQMSAAPKVAIVHENAVISVEDNDVEEVWGPWWFEAGVTAFDAWQNTAEKSAEHALSFAMLKNQLPVPLTPTQLAFTPEGITASLKLNLN